VVSPPTENVHSRFRHGETRLSTAQREKSILLITVNVAQMFTDYSEPIATYSECLLITVNVMPNIVNAGCDFSHITLPANLV